MSLLRSRVGVGIRPVGVGVLAALAVLFGVVALWTRLPNVAFLVALSGQFLTLLGLYMFFQYQIDGFEAAVGQMGEGRQATMETGYEGGVVGLLIRRGDTESESAYRRRVAGIVFGFCLTSFLGFVALTLTGGAVASALL